jgi:adenylylsulfate kinase
LTFEQGVIVIASFLSPYLESRNFVRQLCNNFIKVHLSTPEEECERRDTKGSYAKARNGEIQNFVGVHVPYEQSKNPELIIDTAASNHEAPAQVLAHLTKYL